MTDQQSADERVIMTFEEFKEIFESAVPRSRNRKEKYHIWLYLKFRGRKVAMRSREYQYYQWLKKN